ncbi:MAG: T9SS type A sorting domain-containing protein [Saprospiraceae bacterium]|nr:T9SS type A sorting domain-containing protein [Saprospiraceae bacterium]
MKQYYILFIIAMFSSIQLLCQPIPKELNLIGIKESWKYLPKDTNFIKSSLDTRSTPYSGRIPHVLEVDNKNLLILETVMGQTPWRGVEGCLLHSINMENGNLNWIFHNNTYTGNTHREAFVYSQIIKNDNDNYEILGLRDVKPLDTTRFYIGFYGTPVKRVIDSKDGNLLSVQCSEDTTKYEQNFFGYGNISMVNSEGIIRRVALSWFFEDSILKDKVEFCTLDEEFAIVLPCADSVVHNTGIPTLEPTLFYKPQLLRLTQDTMLILFGIKNPANDSFSPSRLEMYFVDLGSDVNVVKTVDVTEDVYYPQGGWNSEIFLMTQDANIVLAQQIDYLSTSNSFIWLSWYDKNGNKIAKVNKLRYENYFYRNFIIVGENDGILYIAARHDDEDIEGYDILKIYPGQDNIQKCGEIKISAIDLYEFRISIAKLLPDDKIFLGFWASERVDGKDYNYQYYYCFNSVDLGITTKIEDINLLSKNIEIYPNPASDNIILSCEKTEAAYFELIDKLGRIVSQEKTVECEEKTVDISGFHSGLYFVRLMDESGIIVGTGKFVKE